MDTAAHVPILTHQYAGSYRNTHLHVNECTWHLCSYVYFHTHSYARVPTLCMLVYPFTRSYISTQSTHTSVAMSLTHTYKCVYTWRETETEREEGLQNLSLCHPAVQCGDRFPIFIGPLSLGMPLVLCLGHILFSYIQKDI